MRRIFNIASLLAAILVFFVRPGYPQCLVPGKIKYAEEIKDKKMQVIEEEIKINNLLNNLELRKEQLESIIRQAEDIERVRKDAYVEFRRYSGEVHLWEMRIKRQVESGKIFLDEDMSRGYFKTKEKLDRLFYRLNNRIKEAIKTVEGQMKDFQLEALDKYVPCIVPLFKDNLIGGTNKAIRIGYILRAARSIPAEKYKLAKDAVVSEKIGEIRDILCPSMELCDDNAAKEEVSKSIESARQMDDVEFKLYADKLGYELEQKIVREEPELSRQDRILRFLLSSQSTPILKKRLRSKR